DDDRCHELAERPCCTVDFVVPVTVAAHALGVAMRLLFVLDQWPELSETFVVNELEALRRQGHAVRVQAARLAPHPNPEAPADVDVALVGSGGWRDLAWLAGRRPRACLADL